MLNNVKFKSFVDDSFKEVVELQKRNVLKKTRKKRIQAFQKSWILPFGKHPKQSQKMVLDYSFFGCIIFKELFLKK